MNDQQQRISEWFAMMYGAFQAMSDIERQELQNWENKFVDGSGTYGTSDWPGWEKYIGKFPWATKEDGQSKKSGYIYLIRAKTGEHKIGYSIDVSNRLKTFSTAIPFELDLICCFDADDMKAAERLLHERFSAKRIRGEWFDLNEEEVQWITNIKSFDGETFAFKGE